MPEVDIIFCRHTPDNAERVAAHIPVSDDPSFFIASEIAYDNLNPNDCARTNIARLQLDAHRYVRGIDDHPGRLGSFSFYTRIFRQAREEDRGNIIPIFVDAGRTTDGEDALWRVLKGFSIDAITQAYIESGGDIRQYARTRAYDIAESLSFREELVAEHIASIFSKSRDPHMALITGANHYGLVPILRKHKIEPNVVVVDKPSLSAEISVANMIRARRKWPSDRILAAAGLAEWLGDDERTNGVLFKQLLKSAADEAMMESGRQFYADIKIDQQKLPVYPQILAAKAILAANRFAAP